LKKLLTVAASDNTGGAGIQQDLRVFDRLGFWGLSALTGVSSQSFNGLEKIEPVSPEIFYQQLKLCLDQTPEAIKIGVLCNREQISILSEMLSSYAPVPVIADPVFSPSRGVPFLTFREIKSYLKELLPRIDILTPNIPEWNTIKDYAPGVLPRYIYVKGGHGNSFKIEEILVTAEGEKKFVKKKRNWAYSHGTGCAFSSALCAFRASGQSVQGACKRASRWVDSYYEELNRGRIELL